MFFKKETTKPVLKVKKLNEWSRIPKRGSNGSAGYDLYAKLDQSVVIKPGKTELIPTGIAVQIPDGYFGGIYARSGIVFKKGLRPANCVGVVDQDYTGQVMVALRNDSDEPQRIVNEERIAQLIIQPYLQVEFEEVSELNASERGDGGFGSTGVK